MFVEFYGVWLRPKGLQVKVEGLDFKFIFQVSDLGIHWFVSVISQCVIIMLWFHLLEF